MFIKATPYSIKLPTTPCIQLKLPLCFYKKITPCSKRKRKKKTTSNYKKKTYKKESHCIHKGRVRKLIYIKNFG